MAIALRSEYSPLILGPRGQVGALVESPTNRLAAEDTSRKTAEKSPLQQALASVPPAPRASPLPGPIMRHGANQRREAATMPHRSEPLPSAPPATNGAALPDCYVLEIFDEPVGLLILEDRGCVFHAVMGEAWPLDGCLFDTTRDAEQAVRDLLVLKRRTPSRSKSPVGK